MVPFPARMNAERVLLLLVVALLIARLFAMAVLPLMDTTEARYAEISRKMSASGDWVTPWADDGVPFWGKPPFAFWITAASFRVFGVSEFSARLPHFLCALLIGAIVWDLARRQEGRRVAILAAAILSGSALFLISAGAVMTDMALVLGSTAALYGFWQALEGRQLSQRRLGGWIFFAGIATGFLAKGPLILVLVGLPLGCWVALERRWKDVFFGLPWIRGAVLVAALVLPWYWFAEQKTPGFIDYFIIGEHWNRFVTPGWEGDLYGRAHNFPLGTIWLFALIAVLPWPFTVTIIGWQSRGKKPRPRDRAWARYTLLWALLPLLFFTVSRNIIWTYALPALPPAALFLSGWFANRSKTVERLVASGLAIMLLLTAGAGLGALLYPELLDGSTAKSVVEAYKSRRQPGELLIFTQNRPFSASFYSENTAFKLQREADLATALGGNSGFLAYPLNGSAPNLPPGFAIDTPPSRFGKFNLVHVKPIAATRPQVPRR